MPLKTLRLAAMAAVLATAGLAAPALADDRPPSPEERRQIEDVLKREGFVRWGKIEHDDNRFEVEDAVTADGRKFDLKLSNVDFTIVSRDEED